MSPLERQAVREILADVRQEMDAIFGHSQASTSMDQGRLTELVHDVAARWLRARANANLPLVPDPAHVEDEVMNWLVRMGPLEPLSRTRPTRKSSSTDLTKWAWSNVPAAR